MTYFSILTGTREMVVECVLHISQNWNHFSTRPQIKKCLCNVVGSNIYLPINAETCIIELDDLLFL